MPARIPPANRRQMVKLSQVPRGVSEHPRGVLKHPTVYDAPPCDVRPE